MKVCTKCKLEKNISEYYKDRYKKDGYKTICIECNKSKYLENIKERNEKERKRYLVYSKDQKYKERKRKYYQENKENIRSRAKKWKEENLDRQKILDHAYYIKNKDKILFKYKERLKNDPLFKFIQNVKCNVRNSLTKTGYTKNSRTFEIIGIEYDKFMEYIENQFSDGMSWDNYGEWHLDHKTPISWAKTEEEVILLSHFTNYQPLWAIDNLSKGNRYKSN